MAEKKARESENNLKIGVVALFFILLCMSIVFFLKKKFYRKRQQKKQLFSYPTADSNHKKEDLQNIPQLQENSQSSDKADKINEYGNFDCEVILNNINRLSERQIEILKLLSQGVPNKEIADKLHISVNTVKYHLKNIYIILEIDNRTDLLLKINGKRLVQDSGGF